MSEHMPKHASDCNAGLAADSMLARVCAYWTSLRREGTPPARADIDALALGDALPHVFLAEIVTPRVARLRICGHKVESLMGMDMRGMPLSALFTGPARTELQEALAQVVRGARVTLALEAERGFGLPQVSARLALLPLADAAGRCNRLMGVLETEGEPGRAPRRFALAHALTVSSADVPAKAESPALRVIQGGRRF